MSMLLTIVLWFRLGHSQIYICKFVEGAKVLCAARIEMG